MTTGTLTAAQKREIKKNTETFETRKRLSIREDFIALLSESTTNDADVRTFAKALAKTTDDSDAITNFEVAVADAVSRRAYRWMFERLPEIYMSDQEYEAI